VQRVGDRDEVGFPAEGDGGACRDGREERAHDVVHGLPSRVVPAEDPAAEVAELALAPGCGAQFRGGAWEEADLVREGLPHRTGIVAKHRVRH